MISTAEMTPEQKVIAALTRRLGGKVRLTREEIDRPGQMESGLVATDGAALEFKNDRPTPEAVLLIVAQVTTAPLRHPN